MAGRPRKPFAERRKLALAEFREQAIDAQSQISSISLVMPNDEEYEIPHPMLIDDEAQKRLEIVQTGADLDKDEEGNFLPGPKINGEKAEPVNIRTAKALLGAEEHARFIAAGGHSNDITLAWQMLAEAQKDLAEADPK